MLNFLFDFSYHSWISATDNANYLCTASLKREALAELRFSSWLINLVFKEDTFDSGFTLVATNEQQIRKQTTT